VDSGAEADPKLEESAITDLELPPLKAPEVNVAPPYNRTWVFVGLGCSLVSVLSVLCCMGVLFFSNYGYVDISAQDDTAKALLTDAGLTVWDHNKTAHALKLGSNKLSPGGYHIELDGLPKGLHIEPNPFSLSRADKVEIKVRYVLPKSAPASGILKSDQAKKMQQDWAAFLKRDVVEPNAALGAKMVLIPPGEFFMGSTKVQHLDLGKKFKKEYLQEALQNLVQYELPQHRVRISKPFYLSASEVTFAQFSRFATSKEYATEPQTSGKGGTGLDAGREVARQREFTWKHPGYEPTEDQPVTNITWNDADAFCDWLSKKENKIYRLPTEAEWEYACRAGTKSAWSFGEDLRESHARSHMWYHAPLKFLTNPTMPKAVALKSPNEFGLYDMHGNVAEMCADFWGPTYYEKCLNEGLTINPKGPDANPGAGRVVRGGSFLDTPISVRSAFRRNMDPNLGYASVGFRVVCEAPMPPD
jgi:formylglycine-generating enzyme required for sulfatase activity